MSGIASEVAGIDSAMTRRKTVSDRRMVTASVSFSPLSGGSVKPSSVIDEMSAQGKTRLKT